MTFQFADSVTSYRLVYSTSVNDIIDENGFIPTPLPSSVILANITDLLEGTLLWPLTPGCSQDVTIALRKPPGTSTLLFPLYFTIESVYSVYRVCTNEHRKLI